MGETGRSLNRKIFEKTEDPIVKAWDEEPRAFQGDVALKSKRKRSHISVLIVLPGRRTVPTGKGKGSATGHNRGIGNKQTPYRREEQNGDREKAERSEKLGSTQWHKFAAFQNHVVRENWTNDFGGETKPDCRHDEGGTDVNYLVNGKKVQKTSGKSRKFANAAIRSSGNGLRRRNEGRGEGFSRVKKSSKVPKIQFSRSKQDAKGNGTPTVRSGRKKYTSER